MRGRSGWTAAAIAAATLGFAGAAEAKTFEVTRANDPNPGKCKRNDCSLREAVLAANARPGKDKIVLPKAKRYKLTRANPGGVSEDVGDFGDLDVNNDPLAIVHPGKGRARIDANDLDRAVHVQAGAKTVLKRISVTGGLTDEDGGGILSDAPLKFVRSNVIGNVGDDGGGIDVDLLAGLVLLRSAVTGNRAVENSDSNGGGINTAGIGTRVRVVRSTVSGNRALGDGGGVEVGGADLLVSRSTVANNRTDSNGGGVHSAGGGTLQIQAATISGNRAELAGGGLHVVGGNAFAANSTFAGNRANDNGGGINASDNASVGFNAVTIARNLSGADDPGPPPTTGGGIFMIDSIFEVRNSLIALNRVGQGGPVANDCEGETFTSLGNNVLSTKVECDGFTQPTDLERANPKIGQLKKNGGPTKTVALKRGSPAIGHAHNPSAPNRDQRGERRGGDPDAGAFER
jgi:CSLREA domain-containing protein